MSCHYQAKDRSHAPCQRLAPMSVLSFVAMYILMYAMVDRAYMAALMSAPMVAPRVDEATPCGRWRDTREGYSPAARKAR